MPASRIAITRKVSASIGRCELSHLPREPAGANTLLVGGTVVVADGSPHTRERLEKLGIDVISLDFSELTKAEAGLSCCSLIFEV